MTTNDELIEIFREKLAKTGSLDAAFLKAAWIAFQRGIEDGKKNCATESKVSHAE